MNTFKRLGFRHFRTTVFTVALMTLGTMSTPAVADGAKLAPQTKIRVTIVQWIPAKSEYEQWSALGGEFMVSDTGTVTLPVIGSVMVGDLDGVGLAREIATRLKTAIGLTAIPAATVEILEYPPIYVVGDVAMPGQYKFSPGLTALQALAMSGGERRPAFEVTHSQIVGFVGQLQETEKLILRSGVKIARLQAEMAGAKEIHFDQTNNSADGLSAAIYAQERAIFVARSNEIERQSKSLSELRDLMNAEIDTIGEKMKGIDANIESAEEQVDVAKSLVERGATTTSRQIDVERLLTGYRAERLDMITATMRARQNIAETTRSLSALYDARHTQIASELQSEQGTLDQLNLKHDTLQKQLLDALQSGASSIGRGAELPLSFMVTRRLDGKISEFPTSEATALMPGDVIKVIRSSADTSELLPVQPTAPDPTTTQATK